MSGSDGTLMATGMLPAVLLVSAVLTAIVSALLLRLYRRAVVRSMARHVGAERAVYAERPPIAGGARLQVLPIDTAVGPAHSGVAHAREMDREAWRAAAVYATAGVAYALVLAAPWMVLAGDGFPLARFIWLVACYLWPVTIAAGLVAAVAFRHRLLIVSAYAAIVLAAAGFVLVRNPELAPGQLVFFWLYANAPATILLAAFLRRGVRAVGPLVFAFVTAGVAGSFLTIELAGRSDAVLWTALRLGEAAGLGAIGIIVLLHLVGFGVFGAIGWQLLQWLGRRYAARRFSDESLTIDAVWLLFAVSQSFTFAFDGLGWTLAGPVAFAAYKGGAAAGFRLLAPRWRAARRTLLVLRVFALGRRSHALFEALERRWLRTGPVTLIAGPDLATATVEPHEFLDFVGGRLSHRFVSSASDLRSRLTELESGRDPDGRYRVNELFCYADTWQLVMRELAGQSDAILMDLRSFSAARQGCIYELGQLLEHVELTRVLFAVDDTTDVPFLEQTLETLWRTTSAESPNRRTAAPAVRLLNATGPALRELRALLTALLEADPRTPEAVSTRA